MRLSAEAARRLMLAALGLSQPPPPGAGKADVLTTIRALGALQIDPIHVVARSPYLVLWGRLGDYDPRWLDELLAEGALFEYWSHAACFLPAEDWPLYRRLMLDGVKGWRHARDWLSRHPDVHDQVLSHVRQGGAVKASDFERTDGRRGTWWDRKPAKIALEALFETGDLMIARRHHFQRVYDLRERVLPDWDDADAPPLAAVERTLAQRAVHSLGVTTARWASDYFRMPRPHTARLLTELTDEGALLRCEVEGWPAPAFIHPARLPLAALANQGGLEPTYTTLLSPFDPLVWDRERASAVFGFDYRIECYTPAPQRRYGYFTLPILHRGRLVGRLDPKAHRRDGVFEVKALHLEPGVTVDDTLARDVAAALRACAAWHATPDVVIQSSDPPEAAAALRVRLSP